VHDDIERDLLILGRRTDGGLPNLALRARETS
jgi:hypothetical protein